MTSQKHRQYFLFKFWDLGFVFEELRLADRRSDVAPLTDHSLPLPVGLCDFVGAAHLAEGHASDDEDHQSGTGAVLSGCLVLVPVSISSAATEEHCVI